MMQWEDHHVDHSHHLGLKPELSPPITINATPPSITATLRTRQPGHAYSNSGVSWQEQRSVSLGTPASSEALSWVAAWGRMAAAQGSQSAGPSPSSPPPVTQVTTRLVRKSKAKRAASATVHGCRAAPRRKSQPAHTVAYGESHMHIRARLTPPPTATLTPPPASTLYYAPDGTSTTSLPQLTSPPQQLRAQPLHQSPPQAEMQFLSPFAAVCHSPLSTPRTGEAAASRQRKLEHDELWLAGGADWKPSPAPGETYGWPAAAQAELLGCMDAAEMEALDAALETLNEMVSPMSLWL